MTDLSELIRQFDELIKSAKSKQSETTESGNITLIQRSYLNAIEKLGSPTLSELAKFLKLSKPTITISIRVLEKKGFIERIPSSTDKRSSVIKLKEKGRQITDSGKAPYQFLAEEISTKIKKKRLDRFKDDLEKILNKIKNS